MRGKEQVVTRVVLYPKIVPFVAMLLFGSLFVFIAINISVRFGFGQPQAWLGGIGVAFVAGSLLALKNRKKMTIEVDSNAICISDKNGKIIVGKSDVEAVMKHADWNGRGVMIKRKDGSAVFLNIRQYCSENKFIGICKEFDYLVS